MKKWYFIVFIGIASILGSCVKDDNTSVSGDARDKYIGTWGCTEMSTYFGTRTFDLTISKSSTSPDQVLVNNFNQLGNSTVAVFAITNTRVTIPQQTVDNIKYSGSGNMVSNIKINLQYLVNDGQKPDNCTATLLKK